MCFPSRRLTGALCSRGELARDAALTRGWLKFNKHHPPPSSSPIFPFQSLEGGPPSTTRSPREALQISPPALTGQEWGRSHDGRKELSSEGLSHGCEEVTSILCQPRLHGFSYPSSTQASLLQRQCCLMIRETAI